MVDPSSLTTQQLLREITLLKEFFDERFKQVLSVVEAKSQVLDTRIGAMDKAITLVHGVAALLPDQMDEKIKAVSSVHEERFISVQTQFKERDVRTEQSSKDSKVAVDAALQAAKEAVGEQNKSSALAIAKSEASTVKQIDQQAALIQQFSKAVDDKFADIKERITRIEGNVVIPKDIVAGNNNNNNVVIVGGIIAFVIAAAAIAISFGVRH